MERVRYLQVVGRQKDIIIRGGHNIHPGRIEALATCWLRCIWRRSTMLTCWSSVAPTSPFRRPFIPGKGPAGVVSALGPDATAPRIGDRVLAMAVEGGYAELVALGADQCYWLPPRMSFLEAESLSLVYDTAWVALRERARLAPGETVLVLGALGGVGRASVQFASVMGARVLAGISRPEEAALARAPGADAVIDLSREHRTGR
jgi:NADPH:quinone reductase-like Zn-dependent oxidoreductase